MITDWVPRKEIKWYPKMVSVPCIGCGLCAVICGRGVYSYDLVTLKPVVSQPYNCLIGCRTCANLCPVGAIEFPPPEVAREAARKHKIFINVQEMLKGKSAGQLIETVKEYSEEMLFERKG